MQMSPIEFTEFKCLTTWIKWGIGLEYSESKGIHWRVESKDVMVSKFYKASSKCYMEPGKENGWPSNIGEDVEQREFLFFAVAS